MKRKWIFLAPLVILLALLFAALGGAVVRLLWNWLMPPLFGWRAVTFWQALGLLALCRILFGGFGRHGAHGVRRRMAERQGRITPEDRERFRQALRRRFGLDEDDGEPQEL